MKFKNYEDYKAKRDSLLKEAENCLNSADKAGYDAKVKEVNDLDTEFENFRTEQANLNALKDKAPKMPATLENMKGTENMETPKDIVDIIATNEYRNAYLKNLQGKELSSLENAAISGGNNLIPTQTMNRIIGVLEKNPILARIEMTYIPSNVSYPVENAADDASWLSMNSDSSDSEDDYGDISLGAHKLIKTIEIDADVEAMSIDAFENWLVIRLANKIEKACDASVFNGSGKGEPTGILNEGSVADENIGTYDATGLTYAKLVEILGALPSAYSNTATFAMNRKTFYGGVLGIVSDGGQKVVVQDAQSPAKYNILGYPVVCDDNVPVGTIILGDFFCYKFNFAKSPEVKSDGSVGFRRGSVVYRALALGDGKVGAPTAFVVYTQAE